MNGGKFTELSNFFVAGINHKKTGASVRGQFAVGTEQYAALLDSAPAYGVQELFILSTCNRNEIYGFAEDASQLISLLCAQTVGSTSVFMESAYVKNGSEAIAHLFDVGAGLDSQILGDYEIVGQLKQAVKFAKAHNRVHGFLERLVNSVLQSSKTIKNNTALSGGTVSVSFAAVQYIKEKAGSGDKKILLVGIGKIGRNTCKNLVDYLGTTNITLINRSNEKAAALAAELQLQHAGIEQLAACVAASNIILVCTNSTTPTILQSHLENQGNKLVIDLSVPCNVETSARVLPNITLVQVDELSRLKDNTLRKREAEVPKAKAIVATHIDEFMEWHEMRKHVPVLKAVKIKLNEIHTSPLFTGGADQELLLSSSHREEKIQRVINGMATKMRRHNQRGCHYIEAINEFITSPAN